MPDIVTYFRKESEPPPGANAEPPLDAGYQSIEQIVFPAVLVNHIWEIIWINKAAEQVLFQEEIHKIPSASERNILRLFLAKGLLDRFDNWKDIFKVHFRLAKRDVTDVLDRICRQVESCPVDELKQLWHDAEHLQDRPITQQELNLRSHTGQTAHYTLFSCDFREGTLLLYAPASMQLDHILNLLMGRERLIKPVLSRRIPSLTSLCILACRLDSGLRLRTALPPHEYFDLINEFILMSHQCFKEHGGTPGRSFHEGVVCLFLSAPDSPRQYLSQALQAAYELQHMVSHLDKRWKWEKAWNNTLYINMGLHCGREWLGSIPSSVAFEFTVMSDALMHTIKLSKFAQGGSIWASKKVIESLSSADRQRLAFGIRYGTAEERFVSPAIYSQVQELVSNEELERRGLREISHLAVTEIIHLLQLEQ